MTPEQLAQELAKAGLAPSSAQPGWSGHPIMPEVRVPEVAAHKAADEKKGVVEKAHDVIKLLVKKEILKEKSLQEVFELMEEIQNIL